jgi:hypothetical protein
VHQPTRREGHPDHADKKDDSGEQLKTDRNQPGCVRLSLDSGATNVVCSIVDPETDHNSKGDSKLLQSYKSTSNFPDNC